jgi:hypothetical protein
MDSGALEIGTKKFNEVKFLLYDMWISGLTVAKVAEKTGLEVDLLKDVYTEAKLRGREFSNHEPTPSAAVKSKRNDVIDATGDIVATY